MKKFFRCGALFGSAILLALALVIPVPAEAASNTCVWTGGGGDTKFSTPANWSGCGGAPVNGVDLVFDRTNLVSAVTVENDVPGLSVGTIYSQQPGSDYSYYEASFSIGGTNPLTITKGLTGNAVIAILTPVILGGDVSISSRWISLGNVLLNGKDLTVDGSLGSDGIISGQGNIIVNGGMYLGGNSTWTGNLTIKNGAGVDLTSNFSTALGAITNNVAVESGGTLYICTPNGASIPQNLTLGGGDELAWQLEISSCSQKGSEISEVEGSVSFTGQLTLTADTWAYTTGSTTFTKPIKPGYSIHLVEGYALPNSLHVSYVGANGATNSSTTSPTPSTSPAPTVVTDNQPSTDVELASGEVLVVDGVRGDIVIDGGTLKGIGKVGTVTMHAGAVAPGHSPGVLQTGALSFEGGTYQVELGGTASGAFDQLKVVGSVSLTDEAGQAALSVAHWLTFRPQTGDEFVIIDNDGEDAINGTFKGLAEEAKLVVGDVTYEISYVGGDGNDVSLTATNVPAVLGSSVGAPTTGVGFVKTHPLQTLIVTLMVSAGLAAFGFGVRRRYGIG